MPIFCPTSNPSPAPEPVLRPFLACHILLPPPLFISGSKTELITLQRQGTAPPCPGSAPQPTALALACRPKTPETL